MGGKTDVVKGRIKEAAGALTGNDQLRNEGVADQVFGRVKNRVAGMGNKVDAAKGRIEEAAGALTGNDRLRNRGVADQAIGRVKQVAENSIDKVAKRIRG